MNMDIKKWTQNLPVRQKLLYSYLLTFLAVIIIGNSFLYFFVRSTIRGNVESELRNSTLTIQNMVQTAVDSSIINNLRVIAEKNLEIIVNIYLQGLKENKAKSLAAQILTSQSIGKTGYFYAVNSSGVIEVHPDNTLLGEDLSSHDYIKVQKQRKYGYLEYDRGADANDDSARAKVLYMTYFGPWDWIVSAFSYRDEFNTLVNVDDLRQSVLSLHFGKTGYPYVMDSKGNLLIHPKLEGTNIFDSEGPDGHKFIQEICEKKNGMIIYPWQNPGESEARDKLVFYNYIPELDWIVASTGYLDEFYQPLKTLKLFTLASITLMTILIIALTSQVSGSITKPLRYLTAGLKAASRGDFSKRLSPRSTDELGRLESYFNTFIAQLEESNTKLHESEKGFRSIFENSVEGIFQFDMNGNILKVNPSFVAMLGYNSGQALVEEGLNFSSDLIVKKGVWDNLLETIISDGEVKGFEVQISRNSGVVFWCLLNAKGIYERGSDEITLIEGFLSDINAKKVAQEGQEKILEDLEDMVSERTVELSSRISELEQRDQLNRYMVEMGDMLQSCRSIEETYPVINQYLKIFFPQDNCVLYLHDSTKQMIDKVVPAVSESDPFVSMTNESCWALRQGKTYLFMDMDQELTCDHVEEAPHGYICIPLTAHGVTTGLLHIAFQEHDDQGDDHSTTLLDRKTRLCSRLAEHLSLALANLNLQEELKLKSIQDSLTGLANRRHMEEIMQRQFYRMLRHNTPCSLIMLDVDNFKHFNDTYGHDMGDYVLRELGSYLKNNTRGEDLACRFGGEEFVLIMVATDTGQAHKKAEKIRAEIAEFISIPYLSETLHVTVSIGVATSPTHGGNVKELLKSADNALYKAKRNGRNRVEVAEGEKKKSPDNIAEAKLVISKKRAN